MQCLKTFDEGSYRGHLWWAKLGVFQIQVVNDGREALDRAVADRKCVCKHFKGAPLSAMGEVYAEHVERHRITGGRWLFHEAETSVGVDEAFDQPGAAHSIDA